MSSSDKSAIGRRNSNASTSLNHSDGDNSARAKTTQDDTSHSNKDDDDDDDESSEEDELQKANAAAVAAEEETEKELEKMREVARLADLMGMETQLRDHEGNEGSEGNEGYEGNDVDTEDDLVEARTKQQQPTAVAVVATQQSIGHIYPVGNDVVSMLAAAPTSGDVCPIVI